MPLIVTDAGSFNTDHIVTMERQPDGAVLLWLNPDLQAEGDGADIEAVKAKSKKVELAGQAAKQLWAQVLELSEWPREKK